MTSKRISVPFSGRALAASIGKNTSFGVAGTVVHVAARLVVVPVVIQHLGLGGYGIWSLLMTIAAYMSLGATGVKSAFQKYVAEATGTGDFDRASRLLSTGTAAVLLLSVVVLVPLAIFSRPLAVAVGVPEAFLPAASKAILFMALTAVLANVGQTYQSILMGAHRIDLREMTGFVLEPLNAVATIALLCLGYGLLAMCVVFCVYEIVGSFLCYVLSRRVLPSVHLAPRFVSRSVIKELVRFGGSFQLVSMLELLYAAVLPIAILKFFGANDAGVYALSARLVSVATLVQGSYLQAILSGGSLIYASGSQEQISAFIEKSFKAMAAMSIIPLSFIALYGTKIAWVWTGKTDPLLRETVWLLCAYSVLRSLCSLCRVLYRASGGAIMDNAQLIVALVVAFIVAPLGPRIGFFGMVGGVMVLGQFLGLILMCAALATRLKGFNLLVLAPNLAKFFLATAVIVGASVVACYLGLSWKISTRALETIQLLLATVISLSVAGPVLLLTGSISRSEARMMLNTFWRRPVSLA
jgi:O-antigen/teichoic acid export membrane protein